MSPDALTRTIRQVISTVPCRKSVTELVTWMQAVGLAYLRMRRHRTSDRFITGHLSDADVALECIAELFERNSEGRFVALHHRFEWALDPEADLNAVMVQARRLVIRKIDDGLYEMAQAADPDLGRLLRMLRLAAKERTDSRIVRRYGALWFCLDGADPASGHPHMPLEIFERSLQVANHTESAVELLCQSVCVLERQTVWERAIPLVAMALSLRASVVRATLAGETLLEASLSGDGDLATLAHAASREVELTLSCGDGASPFLDLNHAYLTAAAEAVQAQFDLTTAPCHHEHLANHLPGLTREEYRSVHRNRFEYIVKQTRAVFLRMARADFEAAEAGGGHGSREGQRG